MQDQVMPRHMVFHVQCHQPAFHLVLPVTRFSVRHNLSNSSKDSMSLVKSKASSFSIGPAAHIFARGPNSKTRRRPVLQVFTFSSVADDVQRFSRGGNQSSKCKVELPSCSVSTCKPMVMTGAPDAAECFTHGVYQVPVQLVDVRTHDPLPVVPTPFSVDQPCRLSLRLGGQVSGQRQLLGRQWLARAASWSSPAGRCDSRSPQCVLLFHSWQTLQTKADQASDDKS